MELKEFVKDVLVQLNQAVDEARGITTRDIHFSEKESKRTVEFDIAVSVSDSDKKEGKAGIKVIQFAEAGGKIRQERQNSTVSRITFGLQIDYSTRQENEESAASIRAHNNRLRTGGLEW